MKKTIFLLALMATIASCSDHYRYPCQDPVNKDKLECNHPVCDVDGICYDKLNGLPEKPAPTPTVEESPAAPPPAEHCNCDHKGE